MAFTDLDEHLSEVFEYRSWTTLAETGRARNFGLLRKADAGYSIRRMPKHVRRHDVVTTAEIATWRKRMPPRGVRFTAEVDEIRARVKYCAMQEAELESLREVWSRVRAGKIRTIQGVRLVLTRAA